MVCYSASITVPLLTAMGAPVVLAGAALAAAEVAAVLAANQVRRMAEAVGREYADLLKDVAESRRMGDAAEPVRHFVTTMPIKHLLAVGATQGLESGGTTLLADESGEPALFMLLTQQGTPMAALRPLAGRTEILALESAVTVVRDLALGAISAALCDSAAEQGYAVRTGESSTADRLIMGEQRISNQEQRVMVEANWDQERGVVMEVRSGAHSSDGRVAAPDLHGFLARLGVAHVHESKDQPPPGGGSSGINPALGAVIDTAAVDVTTRGATDQLAPQRSA